MLFVHLFSQLSVRIEICCCCHHGNSSRARSEASAKTQIKLFVGSSVIRFQ